ncbi:hypothetical protein M408DRAFT_235505 [Serendipita vermifera MAFF 305830]|uniref:DUF6533 domain-containing protein n=1 Tax=Serendipita vermifera MAFF 305830 TaxID=933852 RepID=A0A0C3BHN3_SERVB|nr:hypothetical protein M408DRAFT_235505 [Serendipita vermifera MAFF 305830]
MDELIPAIAHFNVSRYVSIAGMTLWLYDYLLTSKAEDTRIWLTRWGPVKALYMIARYITVPYIASMMYYHQFQQELLPVSYSLCGRCTTDRDVVALFASASSLCRSPMDPLGPLLGFHHNSPFQHRPRNPFNGRNILCRLWLIFAIVVSSTRSPPTSYDWSN